MLIVNWERRDTEGRLLNKKMVVNSFENSQSLRWKKMLTLNDSLSEKYPFLRRSKEHFAQYSYRGNPMDRGA